MQDLNDLYFFAKVVEKGGFAAAARSLGVPRSRLSRRIATLEAALGVRLLERTTRKLALTEAGRLYHEHAQTAMAEAEAAAEAVARVRREPAGVLRVSCAVPIAHVYLPGVLPAFLAAYPRIDFDLVVTNRRVDLLQEGIDVALRVRMQGDEEPNLVTRRLLPAPGLIVVHPELLEARGPVNSPEELAKLPILGDGGPDRKTRWVLQCKDGSRREIALPTRLVTDDFIVRRDAALAGLGATMLPAPYCEEALRTGQLVLLFPENSMPAATLQAAYLSRRGSLPAVRAFLDFLERELEVRRTP